MEKGDTRPSLEIECYASFAPREKVGCCGRWRSGVMCLRVCTVDTEDRGAEVGEEKAGERTFVKER